MTFVVECTAPSGDQREKEVDSRSAAEDKKAELKDLGFTNIEIKQATQADGGDVAVVDHQEQDEYDLPDDGPSVDEDPLVWMPDEFTDTIDGSVAINRKGFEVLAHHYEIACETELVAQSNGRVVVKATATDSDERVYTAYGSASEDRGDDLGLLVEMADTRAYKRSVSRATGVGMVAVEELQNSMGEQ